MSINGTDVLIEVETSPGSGTFAAVGGLTDNTLSLSSEPIDISNKAYADFRELMDLNGPQSLDVSGSLTFTDNVNFQIMRVSALSKTILKYRINREGYLWAFSAKITSWVESAPDNDKLSVELTMLSSGVITDV